MRLVQCVWAILSHLPKEEALIVYGLVLCFYGGARVWLWVCVRARGVVVVAVLLLSLFAAIAFVSTREPQPSPPGSYPLTMAAFEALRQCGGQDALDSLSDLYSQVRL